MRDFTEEIDKSIDALLKVKDESSKKKTLLNDGKLIYLQIGLFKVPSVSRPKRKFLKLCHSLYGDDPEVCLFVPNRKTGVTYKKTTDELIDFCVDYYTELLEKHKVKGITAVMPLKQLRSEYGTYELRRKLVNRFNLFLCKNSLLYNHRFLTALGKIFKVANKEPFGISFPENNCDYDPEFDKNIKRALFSSSFYIKPFSDNYSIPFGTFSNTKKELKENLKTILDQLLSESMIPGGFNNIRAMYLWPSQCKTVPFYLCLDMPENLPVPKIKYKKKGTKAVEGELSTQPGKKVKVMANGDIIVMSDKDSNAEVIDNESDSPFVDESDEEKDDDDEEESTKQKKKTGTIDQSDEESENDEFIEKMEQRLLKKKRENEAYDNAEEEEEDDDDDNEEDSYETPIKRIRKNGGEIKKNGIAKKAKKGESLKMVSKKKKIIKVEDKGKKIKGNDKKMKNKFQKKETKLKPQSKSKNNSKLQQKNKRVKT